jgi:hypothetical protein
LSEDFGGSFILCRKVFILLSKNPVAESVATILVHEGSILVKHPDTPGVLQTLRKGDAIELCILTH